MGPISGGKLVLWSEEVWEEGPSKPCALSLPVIWDLARPHWRLFKLKDLRPPDFYPVLPLMLLSQCCLSGARSEGGERKLRGLQTLETPLCVCVDSEFPNIAPFLVAFAWQIGMFPKVLTLGTEPGSLVCRSVTIKRLLWELSLLGIPELALRRLLTMPLWRATFPGASLLAELFLSLLLSSHYLPVQHLYTSPYGFFLDAKLFLGVF